VEHIANGSYGRVIYLKDSKWMDAEVEPPGDEMMDSTVVGLEIKVDHVHYKFTASNIKSNETPIYYKFCDLDVRLKTGGIFNLKWTSISQAEWVASLAHKPSYVPPMKRSREGKREKEKKGERGQSGLALFSRTVRRGSIPLIYLVLV
jgi:hypothetical protein